MARKKELESYFKRVEKDNKLPHYPNATELYMEYTEHHNYPFAGGYFDQPSDWREDMIYVSAEIEYSDIDSRIAEATKQINEFKGL